MDIKFEGNKLLMKHTELYEKLKIIPNERKIEFREEFDKSKWFGKPRFIKSTYQWDKTLFTELRNHLQEIWNFFEKYNHWLDETILPLIEADSRRISSKSIIFLLENDIWSTKEVYGKYLIEKDVTKTTISYYRFDTKINETVLIFIEDEQIKEWICQDAKNQILEQFTFLWFKLKNEIIVCTEEEYTKKPKIGLTNQYLINQIDKIKKSSKDWPEASLLNLGRICEIWLLLELGKKHKFGSEDIIKKAEKRNLINKEQALLLYKIKRHYNYLKHKTYYNIETDIYDELLNQFINIIKI